MAKQRFKVEEGVEAYGNSAFVGNVTVTDTLYIGDNRFEFNTNAISVITTSETPVDEYSGDNYKFAKYFITIKNQSNTLFHSQEVLVINDGANAYMTSYGYVWNGYPLADINVKVGAGNVVQLTANAVANALPITVSTYRTIQA